MESPTLFTPALLECYQFYEALAIGDVDTAGRIVRDGYSMPQSEASLYSFLDKQYQPGRRANYPVLLSVSFLIANGADPDYTPADNLPHWKSHNRPIEKAIEWRDAQLLAVLVGFGAKAKFTVHSAGLLYLHPSLSKAVDEGCALQEITREQWLQDCRAQNGL